jgi:hypothetical protein
VAAATVLWQATPSPTPHSVGSASIVDLVLIGVAAGVVLVVAWQVSLRTHPWTTCPKCKGAPRTYHPLFRRFFGLCSRCGGSGRVLRRGAKDPKG